MHLIYLGFTAPETNGTELKKKFNWPQGNAGVFTKDGEWMDKGVDDTGATKYFREVMQVAGAISYYGFILEICSNAAVVDVERLAAMVKELTEPARKIGRAHGVTAEPKVRILDL